MVVCGVHVQSQPTFPDNQRTIAAPHVYPWIVFCWEHTVLLKHCSLLKLKQKLLPVISKLGHEKENGTLCY